MILVVLLDFVFYFQALRYNDVGCCAQVIRKVMKMDAAEPFNVPVNPEALGIPVSYIFFMDSFLNLDNATFMLGSCPLDMFDVSLSQFLPLNLLFVPFSVLCSVKFLVFNESIIYILHSSGTFCLMNLLSTH